MWLELTFISEWHIASGEGQSSGMDSIIVRDHNQLPFVPGRSLKGILREAVNQAEDFKWFKSLPPIPDESISITELLFGSEGSNAQGSLRISSAHLSQTTCEFLSKKENEAAKTFLTHLRHFTRINETSGTAEPGSLRDIEYAIPMSLLASIECEPTATAPELNEWISQYSKDVITMALPLIWHLGGGRQKGMGEVRIGILEAEAE